MARVFITGSTDGLGNAAAQALLGQGHEVVLHARSAARAADIAAEGRTVVVGLLVAVALAAAAAAGGVAARAWGAHLELRDRVAVLEGRLEPNRLHFLDLDWKLVERELQRLQEKRRSGPHAENILRDIGTVAAGSH